MPSVEDNERDFWVGITAFGAVLGTGLYALVEREWWFGAIYTIGGGAGLMWMSPAAKSYLGAQPSRSVLFAAVTAAWLFLAANVGYSVYNRWIALPPISPDDLISAQKQQADKDQKQIADAMVTKETAERNLEVARQQIRTLQALAAPIDLRTTASATAPQEDVTRGLSR